MKKTSKCAILNEIVMKFSFFVPFLFLPSKNFGWKDSFILFLMVVPITPREILARGAALANNVLEAFIFFGEPLKNENDGGKT